MVLELGLLYINNMEQQLSGLISAMQEQQRIQTEQFNAILGQLAKASSNPPSTTASVNVPRFDSYDREKESWTQYLQRLKQHFTVYQVTDATQQRACLLSWVGSETYELLTKLYGQEDITAKTLDELTTKLSTHFKDKKHVQAARYEFYNCKMKPDQSYSDWAADLRGIARNCNFVCKNTECTETYVDDQIRDIIIKETPHADVRRQCLLDSDPSLDEVLKKAETFITTTETDRVLKGEMTEPTTHQMAASYKPRGKSKGAQFSGNTTPESGKLPKLKSCPQCYIQHDRKQCPHRSKQCNICQRLGHISSVCLSKSSTSSPNSYISSNAVDEDANSVYQLVDNTNSVYVRNGKQIWINALINGYDTKFQWDTGATCSMVGLEGYKQLGSPPCHPTNTTLRAYGNSSLKVKGQCFVDVQVAQTLKEKMRLLVVDSDHGSNLFGLDWSDEFGLSEQGLSAVANTAHLDSDKIAHSPKPDIESLSRQYSDVFKTGIGCCKSLKVSIHLKSDAQPSFSKPRSIPYSTREATKIELERLESEGVLERIDFSDWAAPIVVVSKPSGKVRICGDFKQLNQCISIDQHPLPKLDDLMEKLRGGVYFSKLDLADAYLQLQLDDDARKLCVINTPFGLYRYKRMCFGVASSPAQFQRCMDSLTSELPGVAAYLDDLIITGKSRDEHLANLKGLLSKLQEHGFRVNLKKCEFLQSSVEYLGHVIDKQGKRPSESAITALKELPVPQDLRQLKAFLGKVTYYNRFISKMADKAAPLYALLKDEVPFAWTKECQEAFLLLKNEVISATNLAHYDESKTLVLATDASSYGIGAVLSQLEGTDETPIAYGSKTLTETQKNYSQIEREALSIIYGVTKFRQFLYGRKFVLLTDHEPLISIFSPEKNIPTMTAQRLQRWALTLMGFQYEIKYKKTSKHGNADALSRLPVGPDTQFDALEELENEEVSHTVQETVQSYPLDTVLIQRSLQSDATLCKVAEWIRDGWPNNKPQEPSFQPFWFRKDSLIVHDNIILLQGDGHTRVVVPQTLQAHVLENLHSSHWGVVKVKQLARRYVWWSTLNSDIEKLTKACDICRQLATIPPQRYTEWPKTESPWDRLHLDFAGPFKGKMWLICIDSHSKFPYVGMMEIGQTSTQQTIQVLRDIFSIEGLPKTIVTDNGPQFVSNDFETFCNKHGIQHVTSPPYHPSSNGEAERFVQSFKKSVEKNCVDKLTLKDSVRLSLATYRSIPHPSLDWKTPAEVLHGRQPRCLLSLINPLSNPSHGNIDNNDTNNSDQFTVDSLVYARNYASGPKWLPGKIVSKLGSTIYMVETDRGTWKRHSNQLQVRLVLDDVSLPTTNISKPATPVSKSPSQQNPRRYPLRIRKTVERYQS